MQKQALHCFKIAKNLKINDSIPIIRLFENATQNEESGLQNLESIGEVEFHGPRLLGADG